MSVYGRQLFVYDCDDFTRQWLQVTHQHALRCVHRACFRITRRENLRRNSASTQRTKPLQTNAWTHVGTLHTAFNTHRSTLAMRQHRCSSWRQSPPGTLRLAPRHPHPLALAATSTRCRAASPSCPSRPKSTRPLQGKKRGWLPVHIQHHDDRPRLCTTLCTVCIDALCLASTHNVASKAVMDCCFQGHCQAAAQGQGRASLCHLHGSP